VVPVIVVVESDVVLDEVHRLGGWRAARQLRHVVIGWYRVVDRRERVQWQAQRNANPIADQPRGRDDELGSQQVQRAALIVGSPAPPVG
jgi:hypothetical protein